MPEQKLIFVFRFSGRNRKTNIPEAKTILYLAQDGETHAPLDQKLGNKWALGMVPPDPPSHIDEDII